MKCPEPLFIRERHIKTTVLHQHIMSELVELIKKNYDSPNTDSEEKKGSNLYKVVGNVQWVLQLIIKWIKMIVHPGNCLFGYLSSRRWGKLIFTRKKICSQAFTGSICVIAAAWNQPGWPSTDKSLTIWYIHTMEYYSTIKRYKQQFGRFSTELFSV